MKNTFLFLCFLNFALTGFSQNKDRVAIAGSRISIERPENVLISKHTPTIYIDSTIEFMIMEFPNVGLVKEWMKENSYPLDGPEIKESFALEVHKGEAQIIVAEFNSIKDILYCYMGDSSYGIITSCIFKRESTKVRQRALDIIQSMRIVDEADIDWYSYLSFSYDRKNTMKLVHEKYVGGMRFTPNGVLNDSLFNATNITSIQFPPAPYVKSSKDLLLAAISGRLSEMTINDVMFDGEIVINDQDAYKFWAKCSRNGHDFELIYVAFFDPKSSVIIDAHVINDEYQNDAYDFVNSIVLKRQGY